jgi:hypothetical protein
VVVVVVVVVALAPLLWKNKKLLSSLDLDASQRTARRFNPPMPMVSPRQLCLEFEIYCGCFKSLTGTGMFTIS